MWMANIALGILGILLTARMGRETPKINWNAARKFIPSFLRTPEPAEEDAQ
jgi:hypothetical protein